MQHFIPSDEIPPLAILSQALTSVPLSVARTAIEAHTQPGDVILDPFCAGVSVIQAALDLDRKIIAASFNPIAILAVEATLWSIDPRAALTHLADAHKGPQRLRDHVLELYRTRCPVCAKEAVALEFHWDRDSHTPIHKRVRCATCGDNSGAIDDDDQTQAGRFKPRGLPFLLLQSRVIDPADEEAERVNEVLEAYTPRALAAIGDILLKFEGLSDADRSALRPALVAIFDACTALHSTEETARRIAGLKPPPQFVEKNIWIELENICAELSRQPAVSLARSSSPADLLNSDQPAVCLIAGPTRETAKLLPPQSIQLMLSHPPLPRPGFWSLSTVWSAWLWGKQKIEAMLPLLARHRTSWDWQWRAISSTLHALGPALKENARNIFSFANDETVMESVALASAGANQTIEHVACDSHDGTRATWLTHQPSPTDRDLESLALDIRSIVQESAVHILRDRAEPTDRLVLQAGIYAALGQSDVLAISARLPEGDQSPLAFMRDVVQSTLIANDSPVMAIDEHLRWLKSDERSKLFRGAFNVEVKPLADRVEAAIVDLLRDRNEWHSDELLREVYRRFSDQLTPDRALVATCMGSYVEEIEPGRVHLRTEDALEARESEIESVKVNLQAIGKNLGYEVKSEARAQRLVWLNGRESVYSFLINAYAEIDPLLRSESGVLVIPGGRATLLQHKLKRDPRLHDSQWKILKFSALRHLMEESNVSLDTVESAFGLEPPIEQAGRQIQLF